jgi:hypothetical protein
VEREVRGDRECLILDHVGSSESGNVNHAPAAEGVTAD